MELPKSGAQKQCPVDHKSGQTWLNMSPQPKPDKSQSYHAGLQTSEAQNKSSARPLGTERQTSSIPRALHQSSADDATSNEKATSATTTTAMNPSALQSANAESLKTETSPTGHWIYPSEEMFFNAMKRKQHDPDRRDMSSIVPIHNAVNERTWHEILRWEGRQGSSERCGGPKLISFSGDSSRLTPRARFFSLLGYRPPFDRHDWIVDRCGVKVEYVIDYYQGKGRTDQSPLNFYLDVRPKLNSIEGWRMRLSRFLGW